MATDVEQYDLERRAGENEALFRDVNKRINAAKEARSVWLAISEWCASARTNPASSESR